MDTTIEFAAVKAVLNALNNITPSFVILSKAKDLVLSALNRSQ
jgi:hypothetical protein